MSPRRPSPTGLTDALRAQLCEAISAPWLRASGRRGDAGRASSERRTIDRGERSFLRTLLAQRQHVVSRNGAVKAFEGELAEILHFNVRLDLGQDARGNENLPVLCLSAEPRGKVGCGTDCTVVKPLLETDRADGCIATSDADAESERVAAFAPASRQNGQGLAHGKRHLHGSQLVVLHRHWRVEEHHEAVACEMLDRSIMLGNDAAELGVILAQDAHYFLRFGCLRETREAAQVYINDRNLRASRFEGLVTVAGHD